MIRVRVRTRKWVNRDGSEGRGYQIDYTDPTTGKRAIKQFNRRADADAEAHRVQTEIQSGVHVPASQSPTVATAARRYLDFCGKENLEKSTLEQYRQHVDHIVPIIGNVKIRNCNKARVEAFRNALLEEHSRPMSKKILMRLKSILKHEGALVPAVSVKMSARHQEEVDPDADVIPTIDEVRTMMTETTKLRDLAVVMLAAFAGLRASELRGLRWRDVDEKASVIRVRQRADRYRVIGPCKTKGSRRDVPVGPKVVNALRAWRLASGAPHDLVFATATGKPWDYTFLIRDVWWKLQVACFVTAGRVSMNAPPKYTGIHVLRHFFASWCINSKKRGGRALDPVEVKNLMGHSSIKITVDTYSKLFNRKRHDDGDDAKAELARDEAALFAVG